MTFYLFIVLSSCRHFFWQVFLSNSPKTRLACVCNVVIDVSRVVRDIQDAELHKFFSRIVKLTQGRDFGHETIDSLQRLHLILSASQSTRL